MTENDVVIKIPATTANLGPGFDCLGLALDLWNTTRFSLAGNGLSIHIQGEGSRTLALNENNLIFRAFETVYNRLKEPMPAGLQIVADNLVPTGSGLGSSATGALAGLLAANHFLGNPLSQLDILEQAAKLEGHADNAAAALFGGLVVVINDAEKLQVTQFEAFPRRVVVVLPDFYLSTQDARKALPVKVALKDAIYNLGRTALVLEALRTGNQVLLDQTMTDRLHQPYRLRLIPGAESAIQQARKLGAPACLSGAGPSVIAFPINDEETVAANMMAAFKIAGLPARTWILPVSMHGAIVEFSSGLR